MKNDNGMVMIEVSREVYSRVQEDKSSLENETSDNKIIENLYNRLDSYME